MLKVALDGKEYKLGYFNRSLLTLEFNKKKYISSNQNFGDGGVLIGLYLLEKEGRPMFQETYQNMQLRLVSVKTLDVLPDLLCGASKAGECPIELIECRIEMKWQDAVGTLDETTIDVNFQHHK